MTLLDLWDTQAVVLPALHTPAGQNNAWSKVSGLVNAFVQAGARHVVLSLWRAPEPVRQELVAALYEGLSRGRSVPEALREARLAVRSRHPEPRDWAGWVCVGEAGNRAGGGERRDRGPRGGQGIRWRSAMNRFTLLPLILLAGCSTSAPPPRQGGGAERPAAQSSRRATGPLRVHPTNPRYFTDGTKTPDRSWKAVYLTGSHTWANLIDRGPSDPPPVFDFDGYLRFLEKHHHNFIRLWGRQLSRYQKYGDKELHAAPLAWRRTGPGKALDGKPKFDLRKLDAAYFERLRSRVRAAGERGIYVSIMLFGGHQETGPDWAGSPFHRDNNVNGIDGDPNRDGKGPEAQTLSEIPRAVAEVQKTYVRKVIDTVNDLDNVLFEISNESGPTSHDWQYDLIRFIRAYEKTKPKQHPVGMTAGYWPPDDNRTKLDASPADWVSYLFEMKPPRGQEAFAVNDPFVADGHKVSIQDSDHWWVVPIYGDAAFGSAWVWKSFCRGHNPILMEHLPPRSFVARDHPLTPDDPGYVASRTAMGQTHRYAERLNLAAMTPSKDIASTTYCLANPGKEYLVYLPSGGAVTVDLSAAKGALAVEWFDPARGKALAAVIARGGDRREFKAPFSGAAVLYLAVAH